MVYLSMAYKALNAQAQLIGVDEANILSFTPVGERAREVDCL